MNNSNSMLSEYMITQLCEHNEFAIHVGVMQYYLQLTIQSLEALSLQQSLHQSFRQRHEFPHQLPL